MSILSLIISNFGCIKKGENPPRPKEQLTSVSISQSHMDRTYCYNFWAREEKGSYLLDAECIIVDYDNNDYKEINFTDKEITEVDFKQFTELDSKYDFYSNIKIKKKNNNLFICDETITAFYVKYGEEGFGIETNGECFEAVHNVFSELAQKYGK